MRFILGMAIGIILGMAIERWRSDRAYRAWLKAGDDYADRLLESEDKKIPRLSEPGDEP